MFDKHNKHCLLYLSSNNVVSVSLKRKIINTLLPRGSKIFLEVVKFENSRKLLFLKKMFQSSERH